MPGLSLLEVVLSLAILSVAAAYLAQSMFLATENAIRAQKLSQAELIAESVMNQIVSGVLPAQPVNWAGYRTPNPFGPGSSLTDNSQWVYSISNVATEVQGMVGVQVAVQQIQSGGTPSDQPDFIVTRWIIDPNLGLDTPPAVGVATGTESSP
jgi:prepilin-type N-terminal cleavage/methylation domain-containing protein